MKILIALSFVLLTPLSVFSQKHSIDLVGGLGYSYRTLSTSSTDPIMSFIIENRNEHERSRLNWRLGLNYNRRIADRLWLRIGVRYTSVGTKSSTQQAILQNCQIDPTGQFFQCSQNPVISIRGHSDLWFVESPVLLRHEFSHRRLTPYIELGFAPSIYLTTKHYTLSTLSSSRRLSRRESFEGFNNFHLVSIVSFGFNYNLNEHWQLFGQPTFRFHINKTVDAPITEHLYNSSMEVGIRKQLW